MLTDTEGIVLRQTKTSYGRRMIHLFSRKYGKISCGTDIGERGKSKSSLALRPFTYGRYELFKGRDSYNINSADVLKSYYKIGEDVDKYMNGAYVLEFTEKVLAEEQPAPELFKHLQDFFDMLQNREAGFGTLVLAYQTKVLKCCGAMPELNSCVLCGKPIDEKEGTPAFSVKEGGLICPECAGALTPETADNSLIYSAKFGIVNILKYFASNPLGKLENLALREDAGKLLSTLIKEYAAYHLDASNLKSEKLI